MVDYKLNIELIITKSNKPRFTFKYWGFYDFYNTDIIIFSQDNQINNYAKQQILKYIKLNLENPEDKKEELDKDK